MILLSGVNVAVIQHVEQRYNTVGDWWLDDENILQVRVSNTGHLRMTWLIGIHETVEGILCSLMGVSTQEVDKWDTDWEETHGLNDDSEPGDDPKAPYYLQHQIATIAERAAAFVLKVDWNEYADVVDKLWLGGRKK